MSLIQCNECKKEISVSVDSCPNCGAKKPFKNVKLTLDETRKLNSKEKKHFMKLGGDVTYSKTYKIFAVIVWIFVIFTAYIFMQPKSDEQIQKEMEELKQNVRSIPKYNISENIKAYEKLSEYYKDNFAYNTKLKIYKKRDELQSICNYQSEILTKQIVKNKSTYERHYSNGLTFVKWIDDNNILSQIHFSSKNDLGMRIEQIAEYKCTIQEDESLSVKRTALNRR